MNAIDLVVTVSLGSTLATVVVSRDVVLAEGVAALTVLVLFQSRSPGCRCASQPFDHLLYHFTLTYSNSAAQRCWPPGRSSNSMLPMAVIYTDASWRL